MITYLPTISTARRSRALGVTALEWLDNRVSGDGKT